MRMFGLIGLLLALLVVGLLAKKQMGAPAAIAPPSARAKGSQIQQDVQRQLDPSLQRPRVPEER